MHLSSSPDTSLDIPLFCLPVSSPCVTACAFGKVAGDTGGWGQCLAVSFLISFILGFFSAAPAWAPRLAAAPLKVHLPPVSVSVPAWVFVGCSPTQASPCSSPVGHQFAPALLGHLLALVQLSCPVIHPYDILSSSEVGVWWVLYAPQWRANFILLKRKRHKLEKCHCEWCVRIITPAQELWFSLHMG